MKHTLSFMLVVSLLIPCAQAAELGRLFFTPQQRAQLEAKRVPHATAAASNNAAAATAESDAATTEESDTASVLMVNGIVQKKGGTRTIWINGVAQNAGNSDERSPESVPVAIPGQSQPVKVKVGQKLLLDSPPQHKPAENKPAQQNPSVPAPQKQPASDD